MKTDLIHHIGAVTREVTSREHEWRRARVVVASRTYSSTVEDVWDALTNAERIPRWFLPVSGDLRLGGRYQFEGNAGGKITRCEPPRELAVTWEMGESVSWVIVRLSPDGNASTLLVLEHIAHIGDDLWDQYGPGAVGVGWDLALMGLSEYLGSGVPNNPEEVADWSASENGKQFMRRSSEGWCRASIAAGTDESSARAAAARTTAFYTGEDQGPADG